MARLYIGNCTKQHLHIQVRIPDQRRLGELPVPVGMQDFIRNDLNTPQIEAVIRQLEESLGAIAYNNIDRHQRVFSGVCYRLDAPIPVKALMAGIENNVSILEQRGHDTRVLAGIAISDTMGSIPADPSKHRETVVDVEEQPQGPDEKPILRSRVVTRGRGGTGERQAPKKRARG